MTGNVLRVPAVILAGGSPSEMTRAAGVTHRALIEVGGRTMLDRIIDALLTSKSVSHVIVVGDLPHLEDRFERVPDRGGIVENLLGGLAAVGDAPFALVATCDIPFLTPAAVDDVVRRGAALNADFVYPFVPVAKCYARFPGLKRTSIAIREGRVTGGNLVLVRPAFVRDHSGNLLGAYEARKSPMRLAGMLGFGTVIRLALALTVAPSALSVPILEKAVSHLLGGTARGLMTDYAEVATDIDHPEDIRSLPKLAEPGKPPR